MHNVNDRRLQRYPQALPDALREVSKMRYILYLVPQSQLAALRGSHSFSAGMQGMR